MKTLAFAARNSKKSINKQLVAYVSSLIDFAEVELLDIDDYELPIYSPQRDAEFDAQGKKPPAAKKFYAAIGMAGALLISFAEHNGSYTAAFKNLFDWISRIDNKVYQGKPVVMLSISLGSGGAKNVLSAVSTSAPHFGADLQGTLSVLSFYDNFDTEKKTLKNASLARDLKSLLKLLSA